MDPIYVKRLRPWRRCVAWRQERTLVWSCLLVPLAWRSGHLQCSWHTVSNIPGRVSLENYVVQTIYVDKSETPFGIFRRFSARFLVLFARIAILPSGRTPSTLFYADDCLRKMKEFFFQFSRLLRSRRGNEFDYCKSRFSTQGGEVVKTRRKTAPFQSSYQLTRLSCLTTTDHKCQCVPQWICVGEQLFLPMQRQITCS